MRLKFAAIALAVTGALGLAAVASPADAAPRKKGYTYVTPRGNTVLVTRDEDGRTRTRVIVQKRTYLNPGTEQFPGEKSYYDYAQLPNQRASSVLDGTAFGASNLPLPNQWTLPGKNNPFLSY